MSKLPNQAHRPGRAWTVLLIAWIAGLFIAGPWDLPLSTRVADLDGTAFTHFIQVWGTTPSGILQFAAVLLLLTPALRRRSEEAQIIAVILLVMSILQPLVITTAIKFAWGRLRFHQLGGDLALFTPFWQLNTAAGGVSFPSGHTATACSLSPVVVYLWRRGRGSAAAALAVVVAAWTLTVAWGRIAGGYHYLTDVFFSMGLSALLAPFVAAWGEAAWRRWFRKAEDRTGVPLPPKHPPRRSP